MLLVAFYDELRSAFTLAADRGTSWSDGHRLRS